MAQLNFGHVFGLLFINAEADHQIGNNLALLGRFANDFNGLIDIQKDFFHTV